MPESKHRRSHGRALARAARSAGSLASPRPRRKKTNKLYIAASAIIAVLVIAGFAIGGLGGGGGGGEQIRIGSLIQFEPGVGEQQEIGTRNHFPEGETISYDSFPPTSSDHWPPGALVRCGFYPEGLRDERAVHHLEHSNIVVSYNLSDQAQVDQLRQVIEDIDLASAWGITRFYDKIPEGQVAVAAWGILDTMDSVDADRIGRFYEYAGNMGPEQVPCGFSDLETG